MLNPFQKIPAITPKEVLARVTNDGVAFIDVRTPKEYNMGHAKGARNIPLDTIDVYDKELQGYREVYVICQSGGRSGRAVQMLMGVGVNAINVSGGTALWRASGLPVE